MSKNARTRGAGSETASVPQTPEKQARKQLFFYHPYSKYHFDYFSSISAPDEFRHLLLYQAGEIYAKKDYRIGCHLQFCHEISYIEAGSGQYMVNGRWFPVKKGDIVLTRRGDLHDGISDNANPLRTFFLGFDVREDMRETAPVCSIVTLFEQNRHLILRHECEDLAPYFCGLLRELYNQRTLFPDMADMYMMQLLLTARRAFYGDTAGSYDPEHRDDAQGRLVMEIINYIDAHLTDIDALGGLTNVFDYSYSHLTHVFTQRFGASIRRYYDEKRFALAAKLLLDGDFSVTELAYHLNYQSVHAFSKAFAKHFGCCPSGYAELIEQTRLIEDSHNGAPPDRP